MIKIKEFIEIPDEFKNSFMNRYYKLNKIFHKRVLYLLKNSGLFPGQSLILIILKKYDSLTQRELCDKVSITPASMSVVLQRMEKSELIVKKPDKNDMRITRVSISEKGKNVLDKFFKVENKLETECLRNFTSEEKDDFFFLMSKMYVSLVDAHNLDNDKSNLSCRNGGH